MEFPRYLLDLQAGDLIEARHVRDLARLHLQSRLLPGVGYRIRIIPGRGYLIELDSSLAAMFEGLWDTTLSGGTATVKPGLVNLRMPWLADAAGPLRPLDGLTGDGEPHDNGVPVLKLDPALYDEAGYSWICIRAFIDFESGLLLKAEEGGLTLAQTATVSWGDGGSVDQVAGDGRHYGDWPVAMLRRPKKDTKGFGKVHQNLFFNQQHRFVRGEAGATGRHFFWL